MDRRVALARAHKFPLCPAPPRPVGPAHVVRRPLSNSMILVIHCRVSASMGASGAAEAEAE